MGLPTLVTLIYLVLLDDANVVVQRIAYGITKTIQFGFPVFWFFVVQKRRLTWNRPTSRSIWIALASGLAIAALTVVVFFVLRDQTRWLEGPLMEMREKIDSMGLGSLGMFVGVALFYSFIHSGLEEYYWRWFVFGQLREMIGVRTAIAVSSLGFMAHHVLVLALYFGWDSPLTYGLSLCVAVGGAFWAWLYDREDTIMAPWLSHALVDGGIFAVGTIVFLSAT